MPLADSREVSEEGVPVMGLSTTSSIAKSRVYRNHCTGDMNLISLILLQDHNASSRFQTRTRFSYVFSVLLIHVIQPQFFLCLTNGCRYRAFILSFRCAIKLLTPSSLVTKIIRFRSCCHTNTPVSSAYFRVSSYSNSLLNSRSK